ncbi:MAG TPA: hypothetical protein VH415_11490 [Nitrososphaeraceae archaeon]|jgi:hypothetical protein
MAVITNTFYRKRIIREEELKYLMKSLFEKLQDIEKKQLECLETMNRIQSSSENGKGKNL